MRKLLFPLLLIFITLVACNNKKAAKVVFYQDTLNIGTLPSLDYLPFLVAQQQGIYDSLGLKVYFSKYNSERERNGAMDKDSTLDGSIIDLAHAMVAQNKGDSLSVLMQTNGIYYLIGSQEAKVKTLADLNLKNIAVSHYTGIEYFVDKILRHSKMSLDSINKPEINDMTIRQRMLQNGQIDAAVFPEPLASILIKNGKNYLLIGSDSLQLHVTGLAMKPKIIKGKEKAVENLIKGYDLAVGLLQNDTTKIVRNLLISQFKIPGKIASTVHIPKYTTAQIPSKEEIKELQKWLVNTNHLSKKYNSDKLVNPSFITSPKK